MPRGRGRDTLPDDVAAKVRQAVDQARELKAFTNADLADHLGWDIRQVTNATQTDQPLRKAKAGDLLKALQELTSPQKLSRGERQLIEDRVDGLVGGARSAIEHERVPAALIATDDLARLSKWIADGLVKPGVSERKRADLEQRIRSILDKGAAGFAFAANQRLMRLADAHRDDVLSRFGWEFRVEEDSPDSQRFSRYGR